MSEGDTMDRVVIRELLVRCVLGVDAEERREMQDVLISVALYGDLRAAGKSDRLEDAIDYRAVKRRSCSWRRGRTTASSRHWRRGSRNGASRTSACSAST